MVSRQNKVTPVLISRVGLTLVCRLPDKPCGHRLLLGSDTSSSEQEYVKIGHVALPSPEDAATLRRKASEELQQLGPMAADLDQGVPAAFLYLRVRGVVMFLTRFREL